MIYHIKLQILQLTVVKLYNCPLPQTKEADSTGLSYMISNVTLLETLHKLSLRIQRTPSKVKFISTFLLVYLVHAIFSGFLMEIIAVIWRWPKGTKCVYDSGKGTCPQYNYGTTYDVRTYSLLECSYSLLECTSCFMSSISFMNIYFCCV